MSRTKAFGIHFGISVAVFLMVFYILFRLWYPGVFFYLDGGVRGVAIVAIVDLVVGPVLTLILYKPQKKGLFFDMTLIAAMQIAFLVYGVFALYQYRPAVLAFYKGSFYSLDVNLFSRREGGVNELKAAFGKVPVVVYVKAPEDLEEVARLRREKMLQGKSLAMSPELYVDYEQNSVLALPYGRNLDFQFAFRPDSREAVKRWLTGQGGNMEDYAFVPAHARFGSKLIALDAQTGRIVDVLDAELGLYEDLPLEGVELE